MDYLLLAVSLLFFVGLVALSTRLGARLVARTTMPWAPCLKYAAIVVALLWALSYLGLVGATAVTPFWGSVLLVLATHAAVGALYLGLGRVKGAIVGVAAGFLLMAATAIIVLVLFMLGIARM